MTGMSRRRGYALAVSACLVLVSALAFAYWKGSGAGSGSGASETADPLTLSPGTPSAQLYPGSSAAVRVSMTNTARAEVRVGALGLAPAEGDGGFDTDEAHADCSVDALSFATQTNGGAGWTVPAGQTIDVTVPSSLAMAADAEDTCQGATFTVHLRVAG